MVGTSNGERFLSAVGGLSLVLVLAFVGVQLQARRPAKRINPIAIRVQEESKEPIDDVAIQRNMEVERQRYRKALRDGKDEGPLRCRFSPSPEKADKEKGPDMRFELTNTSKQTVNLIATPIFQMTFLVRDKEGKVIKDFYYGPYSSRLTGRADKTGRLGPPPLLKLKSGETYAGEVYLSVLQNHLKVPTGPGRYRLEAVYEQTDLGGWSELHPWIFARSEPLLIDVAAKAPGADGATWELVPPEPGPK